MKRSVRPGYTLVEMLIVVAVLGIAGALVVPTMGGASVLRVQAAVRTVIADVTEAQSDALAYQRPRALVFYPDEGRYIVARVPGATIDPETDTLFERYINQGNQFGDSSISTTEFDTENLLLFDEMGGPIARPGDATPAGTGTVTLRGSGQTFVISIEAYTGRVTVRREADIVAPPPGG
jgi:prepilin-type N-terminal cleavage/methylation domain-containing protein